MSTDASDVTFTTEVAAVDGDQKNGSSSSSSLQAWLRSQLDDYVKWNLLGPNEEPDWQNGRVLLCLVHRLYPDRVPDLPSLLLLPPGNKGDSSLNSRDATTILHEELGVPIPSPPYGNISLMDYLDDVCKRTTTTIIEAAAEVPACTHSDCIPTTTTTSTTATAATASSCSSSPSPSSSSSSTTTITTTTSTIITTSARQVPLISETVVHISTAELETDGDYPELERRAGLVMARISYLRGKLCDIFSLAAAATPSTSDDREEDLVTQMEQFEASFTAFEAQDWAAYESYTQGIPAVQRTVPVAARLQEVDAEHAALGSLVLQNEYKGIRARAKFAQATSPVRSELEFIVGKMAKATTEAGICDLEERVQSADKLVWSVERGELLLPCGPDPVTAVDDEHRGGEDGLQYQQTFDRLKEHHRLIKAWVCEVRNWYNKAMTAKRWIQERIDRIEAQPLEDNLHPLDLPAFPAANQLRAAHQELEREAVQFNHQDAACLRSHLQALLESEKELSPADRAIVEIIPGTLVLLDRLRFLIAQQSYRLQIVVLYATWNHECVTAERWIADTNVSVSAFVQEVVWESDEEKRVERTETDTRNDGLTKRLATIQQQMSEFDRDQYAATADTYGDLNGLFNSELPEHVKARQLAVENGFSTLGKMVDYAQHVMEQRLVMTDFVYGANSLLVKGAALTVDMRTAGPPTATEIEEGSVRSFAERVRLLQEQTMQVVAGVSARIRYPEHPHELDERGTNAMVRRVIAETKTALALLGDTLETSLAAYQRALELQKLAAEFCRNLTKLEQSVKRQLDDITLTKVDLLVERIALEKSDLRHLQTVCDNRKVKVASIRNDEERTLISSLETIRRQVVVVAGAASSADAEMIPLAAAVELSALEESTSRVQSAIASLEEKVALRQREIDGLRKRLDWEEHYRQILNAVCSGSRDIWTWINKIQWRPDAPVTAPQFNTMKQELHAFCQMADGLHRTRQECDITFTEMVKEFEILLSVEATPIPAYFQARQGRLHAELDRLRDSLAFAEMVLEQRTAVTAYMEKASVSQSTGEDLLTKIDEAIQNVMDERTSTSFTNAIERYGREIENVWQKYGQQIGYPRRTTAISVARLSTSDDGINIIIKMAVSKQQDKLCYLYHKMQLRNMLYDTSLRFKIRILRYTMEANEQTRGMTKVIEAIASDRQDLTLHTLALATCADPNTLSERNKSYMAEVNRAHAAWENLHLQCAKLTDDIHRNGCAAYVQTTMTNEATMELKNKADDASNASAQHTQELDIYRNRVHWEQNIQSTITTAITIQDKMLHTLCEQQKRTVWDSTNRIGRTQLTAWNDELGQARKAVDEIIKQSSTVVDPLFERMRASYCGFSGDVPEAVADRQKNMHDLLARLLAITNEQQDALDVLSEQVRATEFAEALACAMQQTLNIRNAIENTDTKCLSDNCIATWHEQLKSLNPESLEARARTDDERDEYALLIDNHQALVDALENAETRLSNRRLVESYEIRTSALSLAFRDMSKSLEAIRGKLDTITGVPADDLSVLEPCAQHYASFDRNLQQQMIEYSEVCALFDMLQQRNTDTSEYGIRHRELKGIVTDAQQSLASVNDALVWASQWKDLHAKLRTLENELEAMNGMAGKSGGAMLSNISARHAETRVVAEKLGIDSAQQNNANEFHQHDAQVETILTIVKMQVGLQNVKDRALAETDRIKQVIGSTASQVINEGMVDDSDLLVRLERRYEAHIASLTISKTGAHNVWTEELECLSNQSANLDCNQKSLISDAQEALDSLFANMEDESNLADLLKQTIAHCKEGRNLRGEVDGCRADVQGMDFATWDKESNRIELEEKASQLEDAMGRFRSATEVLLTITSGSTDTNAIGCLKEHVIANYASRIEEAWNSFWNEFAELRNKASKREDVLSRMQTVLKLCGETHERVSKLEGGPTQLVTRSPGRSLPDMLRKKDILLLQQELGMIETAFGDHVTLELQKLDDQLTELEDDGSFTEQRIEIDDAIGNLFRLMESNRERLSNSLDTGRCLDIADDIELLLMGLREALGKTDKTSRQQQQQHGAAVTDLDPRFRHYKEKIIQSFKTAQLAADDIADATHRQLLLVHLAELEQKWQQQARSLVMGESAGLETRTRKSSLPTRKSPASRLPVVAAPSVQSNTSSPLVSMGRPLPTSSSSSQRTSRLQQRRIFAPSLRRTPSKSASNAETPSTLPPSPPRPPVNNYVADPKNDLDMEIGRIVNTINYKVTVKRVPGESGRYWFGDITPKIAFCRVLKSKMVMVRVGGGWMELTEFLVTHGLFDGDYSVPKPASDPGKPDLRFQECFFETRKLRIRERTLPDFV